MSRLQAAAFLEGLHTAQGLTATDKATLMDDLMEVNFEPGDKDKLVVALAAGRPDEPQARRKQQDFSAIPDFFLEKEWGLLRNTRTTVFAKSSIVVGRSLKVGLRLPSEGTFKLLCSLLLVADGQGEALTPAQKVQLLQYFKTEFRRSARGWPDPLVFLARLPDSPAAFKVEYAEMYQQAYADGEDPVPCQLLAQDLVGMGASYRCRTGRDPAALASTPSFGQLGGNQIAEVLLQTLLQAIGNSGRHQGEEIPMQFLRRRSHLELPAPARVLPPLPPPPAHRSALPAAVEKPPQEPPAPQPAPSPPLAVPLPFVSTPPPKSGSEAARSQSKETEQKSTMVGATAELLDMLDEREEMRRAKKRRPPIESPDGGQEGQQKRSKLKEETQDKKGKKGKVDGMQKKQKVRTNAKARKVSSSGPLLLGCGKCRGSHSGCAQCKNPLFGGLRWQR